MSLPEYVILDFETTGLDPSSSEIIEIGAVRVRGLEAVSRFHRLVQPRGDIPAAIQRLTGITTEMVAHEPQLDAVLPDFIEFLDGLPLVAHNSSLEQSFLDVYVPGPGYLVHNSIDPLALILADHSSHSMESMRKWADVDSEDAHRADKDCEDLLKILIHASSWMKENRPRIARIIDEILGSHADFWWAWFFRSDSKREPLDLVAELKRPELGDLRELRAHDSTREIDWSQTAPESTVVDALHGKGLEGFERRASQERMALEIRQSLVNGGSIALEAPTGTGKSVAYLLPGLLAARAAQTPLVVSTHSKSLQDQLLEKDIPLVQKLLGETKPLRAVTVKGQENYLCLRKTVDAIESLDETSSYDERWATAYMTVLASLGQVVELDRVSHYVKTQHPSLSLLLDQVRSHRTTTIGPSCPFYKSCHFFDSARLAHTADVVIANHSLVFQWPSHLPQIRNIVFDEAHHLEDRITEAYAVRLNETEMAEGLDRFMKRSKRGQGDSIQIARLIATLDLPSPFNGLDPSDHLAKLCENLRARLTQLRQTLPLTLAEGQRENTEYEQTINLSIRRLPARDLVLECIQNLMQGCADLSGYLTAAVQAYTARGSRPAKDSTFDSLSTHAFRFESFAKNLSYLIESDSTQAAGAPAADPNEKKTPDFIRLLSWNPNELTWRMYVAPIEVAPLAEGFFGSKRSVVLTSATLSTGVNAAFVTDRIGLKLAKPLIQLPSPYALEKQARVFIPSDVAQPGTPSHLEALIGFTEQMATMLEGKTLLLLSSNKRLKMAAESLRGKLEHRGITVIDSLTDRKAAEVFKQTERAVLVGGERYGEGLDIPGPSLSCVIVEKINEAMTRGPMADARKARTRFGLYDYDFPLRMMWLKQRVGRLIRSPSDTGCVVVFDPRYSAWSQSSRRYVNEALAPMPIRLAAREQILMEVERTFKPGQGFTAEA